MNKKGFTLIELLAIIVVMGIVAVLVAPNIIKSYKKSKEKSYDILIENIETAGENYYLECDNNYEYLTGIDEGYCYKTDENTIEVSLGELAELGILKASGNNNIISNPKNNKEISNCTITITKEVNEETWKTTFSIDIPDIDNPEKSC